MTEKINDIFSTQGYYLEKSVFDLETVKALRSRLLELHRKKYNADVSRHKKLLYGEDTMQSQTLLKIFFFKKIVERLKTILRGNFTVIPAFSVQISSFGIKSRGGWHFDCQSEIPNTYLQDPNYRFLKCAICLQDNHLEYGGGIDVLPGSHRIPALGNVKANFLIQRIKAGLQKNICGVRVPIQAGDVLFFDSRLYHRSSPPSKAFMKNVSRKELDGDYILMERFNENDIKINLFFDVCQEPYGEYFIENSVMRANEEIKTHQMHDVVYSQYCSLDFPNDFPECFTEIMRENEIEVAYVKDQALRERFKNYLRKCDQSSSSNQ